MLPYASWIHVSRAAFYTLNALFSDKTITTIAKNNKAPLAESLANLSLKHEQGVMQHKASIASGIISEKFPLDSFYKSQSDSKLDLGKNPLVDSRVLNEVPLIKELKTHFDDSIEKMLITGDSLEGNFPHQKQTNQDFWVNIIPKVDRLLGINTIVRPHDGKAGIDMLKHSSRGTLGLLTYDNETGNNVQTMNTAISTFDLLQKVDRINLSMLIQALTRDGLYDKYRLDLDRLNKFLIQASSLDDHMKYQKTLWDTIHRDPQFDRSISLIFTKVVEYAPLHEKAQAFHDVFISKLIGNNPNKLYNLDRLQDRREVYSAMLLAYRDTVDPTVFAKIKYLEQDVALGFTKEFISIVSNLYKQHVINTL